MSPFIWLYGVPLPVGAMALAHVRARLRRAAAARPLVAAPVTPAAVGEDRSIYLVCKFRGLYGNYPRQFHGYRIKLTPEGLLLQPGHIFKTSLPTLTVTEDLLSARVRPFEDESEARRLGSTGVYASGRPLEDAGWEVICCRTSGGLLEFAVLSREEHVLMAWIDIVKHRQATRRGGGET